MAQALLASLVALTEAAPAKSGEQESVEGGQKDREKEEASGVAPSCIPVRATELNFEELTDEMAKALEASASEWTAVASDGSSAAGWKGGALLTGADQTAMAAEAAVAAIAIRAALTSRKKIQSLVDKWVVCSQLRRTIREGGSALQTQDLCRALETCGCRKKKGLLKVSRCPSHGKRPERKREPPTTTNVARVLNDKADGEALAKVKHEVEENEQKIKEDVKWAQRALQTVAKLYFSQKCSDEVGDLSRRLGTRQCLDMRALGVVIQSSLCALVHPAVLLR